MTVDLSCVKLMLVHSGRAHFDEVMACAIAYAYGVSHDVLVQRRNPTPEELEDPKVLVLDVGGRLEPEKNNFDHHQRAVTDEPKCAYVLLAQALGVEEELKRFFPWYDFGNLMDVRGPYAVSKSLGISPATMAGVTSNPLNDYVLRRFADDPDFRHHLPLSLSRTLVQTKASYLALDEAGRMVTIAGLPIADMRACETSDITHASAIWFNEHKPACAIFNDRRGTGLTFLRHDDDPRLNFAKCAGEDYALFAHPGGFLLKTVTKDVDLEQVLTRATV